MPGHVNDLAIFGDQAYIDYLTPFPGGGYSPGGLQIVDVATPKSQPWRRRMV